MKYIIIIALCSGVIFAGENKNPSGSPLLGLMSRNSSAEWDNINHTMIEPTGANNREDFIENNDGPDTPTESSLVESLKATIATTAAQFPSINLRQKIFFMMKITQGHEAALIYLIENNATEILKEYGTDRQTRWLDRAILTAVRQRNMKNISDLLKLAHFLELDDNLPKQTRNLAAACNRSYANTETQNLINRIVAKITYLQRIAHQTTNINPDPLKPPCPDVTPLQVKQLIETHVRQIMATATGKVFDPSEK